MFCNNLVINTLTYHRIQPLLLTHLWILTNVLMEGALKRDVDGFHTKLAGD